CCHDDLGRPTSIHTSGTNTPGGIGPLMSLPPGPGVALVILRRIGHQSVDMVRPPLKCRSHLPGVPGPIINSRYARLMYGLMVEDCLNNMGQSSKFCHSGRRRPPKIVQSPRADAAVEFGVEASLVFTPRGPSATKHKFATRWSLDGSLLQDGPDLLGDWKFV